MFLEIADYFYQGVLIIMNTIRITWTHTNLIRWYWRDETSRTKPAVCMLVDFIQHLFLFGSKSIWDRDSIEVGLDIELLQAAEQLVQIDMCAVLPNTVLVINPDMHNNVL